MAAWGSVVMGRAPLVPFRPRLISKSDKIPSSWHYREFSHSRRCNWQTHPKTCKAIEQAAQEAHAKEDAGASGLEQRTEDRRVQSWEHTVSRMMSAPGYFGEYQLKPEELDIFRGFAKAMRECSTAFFAVAISNILLTIMQSPQSAASHPLSMVLGVTVGNFALWSDSLLMAAMLYYGGNTFQRITQDPHRDKLPFVFQGIGRLSLIFEQFAVAATALATIHTLEAAALYPKITAIASALFFSVAVVRSLALTWLMQKRSKTAAAGDPVPRLMEAARKERSAGFFERVASRLVLGHLLAYNSPKAASAAADPAHGANGDREAAAKAARVEHEFTAGEEQTLRICIDAMHTAGLALGVQGIATSLLAFATAASGSLSSAGPTAYNGVNKIIAATLLFRASSSFDNILISEGRDVSNLLRGLGMNGLSKLFHNLNSLAWGVVASQLVQAALPFIRGSVVAQMAAAVLLVPHVIRAITALQDALIGV